ncbi:MAG: MFS transporter [Ilumatobacteraceae bacterium]
MMLGIAASLRIHDFRRYFVGALISQLGIWVRMIGTTLLVLRLSDSGLTIGVLTACQFGPILIFGLVAGSVADRKDRRQLLLVVQVVLMGQSLALAGLALVDTPSLMMVFLLTLVGGAAMAFDNPTRLALVSEIVPDSHIANAVSLHTAVMTTSRVVGPPVAGLLVATVGFTGCFLIAGVSCLGLITSLLLIGRNSISATAPRVPRGRTEIRDGLRYVQGQPILRNLLIMTAIVALFAYQFQTVIPLFVTRSLGGIESDFTWVFSVLSLGSLVGALVIAHRAMIGVRHVTISAVVFGVGMLFLASAPGLAVAFVMAFVVGATATSFMTVATSLLNMHSDQLMRGRVLSLHTMLIYGTAPIGAPLLGLVADLWNARVSVAIGAMACFLAAGWGVLSERDASRL